MLTRLYIDNFRCFEKFEWRPGRKQLILGRNGSGKSSFMDALLFLCEVAVRGERIEKWFKLEQRTRWLDQAWQSFEIEAQLSGQNYIYKLRIGPTGNPPSPVVQWEALHDYRSVLEFENGEVEVAKPGDGPVLTWKLDPSRSALSTAGAEVLVEFRNWLAGISCWHINPVSMGSRAESEDVAPRVDLGNFAAWYRHLVQAHPRENTAFLHDLRESLDGFDQLTLANVGESVRILYAEFLREGNTIKIPFGELSDGQRCLICLYAIMHFVVAKGGTAIIDEPDNFISLREIQPWLMAIEDMADDHKGQVILISHHPEILNQWAGPYGVQFIRNGAGPVRVEKFKGDPESPLSAAELVARGWDLE
jgi:predicted ATPase